MTALRVAWLVLQAIAALLLCLAVVVGMWVFAGLDQHG